jgi:hypothetical protein
MTRDEILARVMEICRFIQGIKVKLLACELEISGRRGNF